jgi:hypothetical protein
MATIKTELIARQPWPACRAVVYCLRPARGRRMIAAMVRRRARHMPQGRIAVVA